MEYCSKPRDNYRQRRQEEEILPRLFTPKKALLAHDWLRSANYNYDEKLAVLKQFWIKDEERQATDKVLKESFHPQVAPRVRVWLNEANGEDKKAIMKLFRSIANKPSPEKATTVFIKPGKTYLLPKNISSEIMQSTDETMKKRNNEWKKVRWEEEHNKAHKNGRFIGIAEMRTEFDIAPDWRAPKLSVVPMTQITRQVAVQERLPRLTKHTCLPHNRREFVIHPEWVMH